MPTPPPTPGVEPGNDDHSTPEPDTPATPLSLVETSYTVADRLVNNESVVCFKFNKRVKGSRVTQGANSYVPTNENGDSTLTIKLPLEFGNTYKFDISATDVETKGNVSVAASINTYENKYEYDGTFVAVSYDNNRETMWMTTVNRDRDAYRLYRISMTDPSTPTAYKDFVQSPNVMALNPYNGKLYVGTLVKDLYGAQTYDFKIHILDPNTLKEEDSFVISEKAKKVENADAEFWLPDVSPKSMAFTEDGLGVVVLQRYSSQGTELCYIDSKNGHKLSFERECWMNRYMGVTTNYDKKSLLIYCEAGMGADFYTLSRSKLVPKLYDIAPHYHSTDPNAGGNVVSRIFHRSKPLYYVQSVYSLCRIDYSTDTYTPVMVDDARGTKMEVDYLNDNCIVSVDPYLKVVKYKDVTTDEIKYVGNWYRGVSMDSNYPMFHNTSRDVLITVFGPNYKSYITTYDMKRIRH